MKICIIFIIISNQNASGHKPSLHARSVRNSWGQVFCFGHDSCWTLTVHADLWGVMLCEEPVAAAKGCTLWRGWKVKFPWDNSVTEQGGSCGLDPRDLTALLHVLVGEGKDWRCRNIKHCIPVHSHAFTDKVWQPQIQLPQARVLKSQIAQHLHKWAPANSCSLNQNLPT